MKQFDLQDDDPFVVLACDGVWDMFNEQQAVDLLQEIKVRCACESVHVVHVFTRR